ncbi:SDR family NAD(P)-dependent oxidoreductase [Desulfitibacter alkalitolerans]|uniref:SDR family NAD(P)-dependent oxidoreductase n=1 Tax=Desulfitibacter alkalitolerans TaxID=264641 RepID=UPI0004858DA2|nr:SDR family oxidoreductase [Desulfitibacter alkalitolerans]
MRLKDKTAIITGGGGGIGWSAGLLFQQEGAKVVLGDINDLSEENKDFIKGKDNILFVKSDVSTEAGAKEIVQRTIESFGRVDILINNAGINPSGTVVDTPLKLYEKIINVNLTSAFLCSKYAIPYMLEQKCGSIVNISSINGIRGNVNLAAYCASKGGMVSLTHAMAMDYADKGIRVNCICPGSIKTKMLEDVFKKAGDKMIDALLAKSPMGRFGEALEVAYAALFLASDEASFITGIAMPVDGGRSIR